MRGAQADRSGGNIDIVGILGPRGIGLRAAESAETFDLFPGLMPEKILDRMEDRRCMRFDRHPVLGTEHIEIERRHHRRHRRAGRLMTAHFEPVPGGTKMIGIVDHPARQPQHLALKRPKGGHFIQ